MRTRPARTVGCHGRPDLRGAAVEAGHYATLGITLHSLALAVPAGGQPFHSILDSLFMFAACTQAGRSATSTGWVPSAGRCSATSSAGWGW
ncbi:MAG TPA: hypothetical protein VLR26_13650 [Frankiaceae bacterium]|nr:hypothetical protein [Frankiaceae bacterium]